MSAVADYLAIPFEYCQALGGLRWSADGDAVETVPSEREPASTFVVTPALVRLIEGFTPGAELPSIGFLLHFIELLGASMSRTRPLPGEAQRLDRTFRSTGRLMRNAGALCAAVCADVPRAAAPADPARVAEILARPRWNQWVGRGYGLTYAVEEVPALSPQEFESHVLERVAALSDDELRHWLRHGQGRLREAGRSAAQALAQRLAALAAVAERPRLAGVGALVELLAGSLSLPPRRRAHSELPSGGYADLATRGSPEQILPAQFALDDDEFVRRFAERELLYFHRETPHSPAAERLILVVDQGVRTWGTVRLVLAAAALALGRQAAKRGLAISVATTGPRGRVVDAESAPHDLGGLLEASDLSAHPGDALERVLRESAGEGCDVVLMTHRRSLQNAEVGAAAKGVPQGSRLFAVSVDPDGEVNLAELRDGTPVAVASCRVEMPATGAAVAAPRALTRGAGVWEGDAEPVPYPFPLGALQRFRDDAFVFDDQGEWLLLACAPGLLHAWKADGSRAELLPRAWVDRAPVQRVEALLGVAGGFVVVGTNRKELALCHYDLARRSVAAHRLGVNHGPERIWWYDRRHHAVVGCTKASRCVIYAVDLASATGDACYRRWMPEANVSPRARAAANAAPPEDELRPLVLRVGDTVPENGRVVCLDPDDGVVSARRGDGRWAVFPSYADGRPALLGGVVLDAQWRGPSLGLLVHLPAQAGRRLVVFHEELERTVADLAVTPGVESFALARGGGRFAVRVDKRQIAVHEIGTHSALYVTPLSKGHSRLDVELANSALVIRNSRFTHLVRWDEGPLRLTASRNPPRSVLEEQFGGRPPRMACSRLLRSAQVVHEERFDALRFVSAAWSDGLGALTDVAGHVVLVDASGAVVCIFHVYRQQIAVWLPDGTRLGPVSVLGGPATFGGEAAIAEALRAAAARGRELVR